MTEPENSEWSQKIVTEPELYFSPRRARIEPEQSQNKPGRVGNLKKSQKLIK